MDVLDDKSFTELSVALLDTNQSEIQSVVFGQSDIPVNTQCNDISVRWFSIKISNAIVYSIF